MRHLQIRKKSFLLSLVLLAAGCHERSVRPGINDPYRDSDVDTWIQRFESESREIYEHRRDIIDALDLSPGAIVADVGAGTGFLTLLLAEKVGPEGKVFAVDIKPEFLDLIRDRAAGARLTNVETVLCKEDSVELRADSIDVAFTCDTYHHLEYPKSTMTSIYHALRPGGELFVIDFDRVPGVSRQWVLDHVRTGKEEVRSEIAAVGFDWVEDLPVPFFKENYLLRFRKPQ